MYNLGERIRQIRKWRGLSQSELEHRSGIKREYLSKLETSDLKNPTYSTLLKLSDALDISLTSLIEAVDKPLPHNTPVIKVVSAQKATKKGVGSNHFAVPIISEKLAASNPLFLSERDIEDYALVPAQWLAGKSDPNRYRCVRLTENNQAMSPLLCPGSIVCFDTKFCDPHKLQRHAVILRDKQGKAIVRYLKLGDGYIIGVPENLKQYSLNIFPLGKDNPIIGKVIWCLKQVQVCSH